MKKFVVLALKIVYKCKKKCSTYTIENFTPSQETVITLLSHLNGKSEKFALAKSSPQAGQHSGSSKQNTFGPQCWKHTIPGSMLRSFYLWNQTATTCCLATWLALFWVSAKCISSNWLCSQKTDCSFVWPVGPI